MIFYFCESDYRGHIYCGAHLAGDAARTRGPSTRRTCRQLQVLGIERVGP